MSPVGACDETASRALKFSCLLGRLLDVTEIIPGHGALHRMIGHVDIVRGEGFPMLN